MDRRKAIINMSLSAAGLGFSSTFISALTSCEAPATLDYHPMVFTADQDQLVQSLVEIIIPTTETPGAKDAKVNQYIDRVLAMVKDSDEKAIFMEGLKDLGKGFVRLSPSEQEQVMKDLEASEEKSKKRKFFDLLKSMTIVGYYTSEIGASQELEYVHMAGYYDGDVPYEKVGKGYY